MTEPVIHANRNSVLNPDFAEAFLHWRKGPVNQRELTIETEPSNGIPRRFLRAANESSVSQVIVVPKSAGSDASYVLSCDCEVLHEENGTLRLSIENKPWEIQEIVLRPGTTRSPEAGPVEFTPIPYKVPLTLPIEAQDTLVLSIHSPRNQPNDYFSSVRITDIRIDLHLPPARLQAIHLDQEVLAPDQPLYLCQGATASLLHQVTCVLEPGHAWEETQGSLTIDKNPDGAIVTMPGEGIDKSLGEPWGIDCPVLGGNQPSLFTLFLWSEFTAEPYRIEVSLGHHRVVFREVQKAAYFPVLAHQQTVKLGVQVASFYTGKILEGLTVTWSIAGQGVLGGSVTQADGWAYFEFTPTAEGTFNIVASVASLYYASGVVTEIFEVLVLANEPWDEVMAVVAGVPAKWPEKTGYPNRGSSYTLQIKVPTFLIGTQISLGWTGDSSAQLGVAVTPDLDEWVLITSDVVSWTLDSADLLDGKFELTLTCSMLLLASPPKRMSLARNEVRIKEFIGPNREPISGEDAYVQVHVVHDRDGSDGEPVMGALAYIGQAEAVTGLGGWASFHLMPEVPGEQDLILRVKANPEAISVEHAFKLKSHASSPWPSQVKIIVGEQEVETAVLGMLISHGSKGTLKVVPYAGSEWIGKNITMDWLGANPGIGLKFSDLGVAKVLSASGAQWEYESVGTSRSSLFALRLQLEGVEQPRHLMGRFFSLNELLLMLDQMRVPFDTKTSYPCLGAIHDLRVMPEERSALIGLQMELEWGGTPPPDLNAVIDPPLGVHQDFHNGGARWKVDFSASQQPGTFSLNARLPQFNMSTRIAAMSLGHNKVRITRLDGSPVDPVVGEDKAWMRAQITSPFTDEGIANAEVEWKVGGVIHKEVTNDDGWVDFSHTPTAAGLHQVTVSARSRFDNYVESHVTDFRAHATNPWNGLRIGVDGGQLKVLGSETFFPRRNGQHVIELDASADNPLNGQLMAVGMTGSGPGHFGMSFTPGNLLGSWQIFPGLMQFEMKVGDERDGSCELRLASARMAQLSPAIPMSVGSGAQVLKIDAPTVNRILDWGEELVWTIILTSSINGKPMANWVVTWSGPGFETRTSITDFHGRASVGFVPTTAGSGVLTATVGDASSSAAISLNFVVNEPRQIAELISIGSPGQPGQEISAQATVVSAIDGKSLADVEVMWELGNRSLEPTFTDAEGKATVRFRLGPTGETALWATVRGGVGGWDVKAVGIVSLADVLKIESLESDTTEVYQGETVQARVRAVYEATGNPGAQIRVYWTFPDIVLATSLTDDNGEAVIEFIPPAIGTFDLEARIGSGSDGSKALTLVVRDPLDSPLHAAIDSLVAVPNPVTVRNWVTITAKIVATRSREPMPDRSMLVSRNGLPFIETKTDHMGLFEHTWQPQDKFERVSLDLRFQNPGGDWVSGSLLVVVNP